MTPRALLQVAVLTTIFICGPIADAGAQTSTPPAGPADQTLQHDQPGSAGRGMMTGMGRIGERNRCDVMGHMMRGMNTGMMDGGLRMRMMFAIADADGDGSLSFEEVTAIHKRVFTAVDANKDGKVTPDELRRFFED